MSSLEVLPSKGVGASPSLPLASIMTTLSQVRPEHRAKDRVRFCPTIPRPVEEGRRCMQNTKVENVTTVPARDRLSGRVADGNDRPCMVANAGVDP